jgi:N-acetylglucosamine-6-phosphate deacetylase
MNTAADNNPPNLGILNARVPGYEGLQHLLIGPDGVIQAINPVTNSKQQYSSTKFPHLDVAGDWISLGGLDLQINGALGLAFPDLTPENAAQLPMISHFLWEQGIDGFLPTIVTTAVHKIHQTLAVIAEYTKRQAAQGDRAAAKVLGVHLEGPFLNSAKRGAHPAEYLLPFTLENVKWVLDQYADLVTIITLAPELDPTGQLIPFLTTLGITVSLGHSQATAEQAQQAFAQGATMVTHAFNAMPSLHHREPGLLGAAIANPQVYCGLIADGQHVSPMMMEILLRASHYDRGIFLVSDALAPLGLPDGVYPWDSRQIEVNHGTARLPDGTLSGTTMSLLVGVQNVVKWGLCSPDLAISLATEAPRQAIGLPGLTVAQGHFANLLRWHYNPIHKDLTWRRLSMPTSG